MGVPRSESGRELMRRSSQPAAVGQGIPTGVGTEEGQPQPDSRVPTVTKSGRESRRPNNINASKLGDITKVFLSKTLK